VEDEGRDPIFRSKVFAFPNFEAEMITPSVEAIPRSAVTPISRATTMTAIHAGTLPGGMSMISAAHTSNLSASGFEQFPQVVTNVVAPRDVGRRRGP